ncbi:7085_t:CDS:2, partial [Acaulospora colombiana]
SLSVLPTHRTPSDSSKKQGNLKGEEATRFITTDSESVNRMQVAPMSANDPSQPLRILSFGPGCYSQLITLHEITSRWSFGLKIESDDVRPADYFDQWVASDSRPRGDTRSNGIHYHASRFEATKLARKACGDIGYWVAFALSECG